MLSFQFALTFALAYLLVLFAIAYWGDKNQQWQKSKPIIYSLGLGVYCTSWAFYGVTGQAAETGWWFTPTFTGSILVYILAWPLVLKVAKLCREYDITSLADFIATRYGQSAKLAGLIAFVSVVAVVPYISLQIRAITNSFNTVTATESSGLLLTDNTLFYTLLLAAFAILFGTRRVRSSEHNPGLMLAIAFESIVKLLSFLVIAVFVCFFMFDGLSDIFQQASVKQLDARFDDNPAYMYLAQTLLGVLMMFCLPRQFHMAFIENNDDKELATSRWFFPLYMVALNLFVLPIAYAGMLLLGSEGIAADTFMLQLPITADNSLMTAISFLGGFSAASSMVIVASVVLSIMVSNDLVAPWLLRGEYSIQQQRLSPKLLLAVRRAVILLVMLAAYFYHRVTQDFGLLANTGLMAMSLLAQFSPALLLGLLWHKANFNAAYRGIIAGASAWLYCMFIPTLLLATQPDAIILYEGLFGIDWLRPTAMFGLDMDIISHGILVSLGANLVVFIYYSLTENAKVAEQVTSLSFIQQKNRSALPEHLASPLTVEDVSGLMSRFMDPSQVEIRIAGFFPQGDVEWTQFAPPELEKLAEREMSAIIGGSSAKLLLDSAKRYRQGVYEEVVDLVDEASEVLKFNRSLLQSTIENINQGISVVDKELRLVAWNGAYLKLFDYPEEEIFIGRPVEEIIRFNARRGMFDGVDQETEINKRINYLKDGQPYRFQRVHPSGKVIEMSGNPLPGGGFVTTYTDITEFVETQNALEEINVHLEQRVEQRTQDLQQLNDRLEEARQQAEQANIDKTRYFAAVSHDLLQPFNAATLFCSILQEKTENEEIQGLSGNIHNSLENAEQLLSSILELSKLDAGAIKAQIDDFDIQELLKPLAEEFGIIAAEKGLDLKVDIPSCGTRSDKKLLRRLIQNLLSNAIRYTHTGSVSLLVEVTNEIVIRIIDTGEGIKAEDQQRIFNDFEQVNNHGADKGLGLGLAIASRICRILGHPLSLSSDYGSGSEFCIGLPIINLDKVEKSQAAEPAINRRDLTDISVLVLDNDADVLEAMCQRLKEWGCEVSSATDLNSARLAISELPVNLIIADFHLDDGVTGLDVIAQLKLQDEVDVPVIFNSANHSEEVRAEILDGGYSFLTKPVKPAALKRLIKRFVKA